MHHYFDIYLVGEVGNEVLCVVVVLVHGESDVAAVVEHQVGDGVGHQHVTPNVKLATLYQQRVVDIPENKGGVSM